MGTCGSKVCNCFRPPSLDCTLPEEKLVISKSPPATDPPVLASQILDSKLMFPSSSSISCNSTVAATTATTTATTFSSPSSSSSSISINSGVVLDLEMPPSDAEMAKTAIGCPQGPALAPSTAAGVATKQPMSRARAPLQVIKRQRSTSPAVRGAPRSYRTEKTPPPPPRRRSNTTLLRGGGPGNALHGRRRCQACSPEEHAAPRKFAARKNTARATRPRASTVPKFSNIEPAMECVHHHVDVARNQEEHHSEVVQTAPSCSETSSRVLIDEELNNPLISMDCFIFL